MAGYTDIYTDSMVPKQLAEVLEYQVRFEQLVATITTGFININVTNFRAVVKEALGEIGVFAEADYCYLALLSGEGSQVADFYEWCSEGVASCTAERQDALTAAYPWLLQQTKQGDGVYISQTADLPLTAGTERKWLERRGFRSILRLPMVNGRHLLGILGLDSRECQKTWSKEHVALLKIAREIFVNAIERHRAEVALQKSELKNKAILNAIPDSMFQVTGAGIIQGYIPSKQNPLPLPSPEVTGKHINVILPPERGKMAAAAIAKALATGEVQLFEYDLVQANKRLYFEARVVKAGEDIVLVIVRDICERWQSEACDLSLLDIAVKAQEAQSLEEVIGLACERVASIFGTKLLWVGRKEPDGSIKLFTIRNKSEEYFAGLSLRWDGLPEDTGLTGTVIRTGKLQLMDIDDPRLWSWRERLAKYSVSIGASFPLKVGGVVLGALTVYASDRDFWSKRTIVHLTNFAEQIALALQVIANRKRLKLLTAGLEAAANAIVITSRRGQIQWVNPAFLELHGYTTAEAMHGNVRMFGSGEYPPAFYKAMFRYVLQGRIWQGEVINRRKDGSLYTADVTITPLRDEAGEITNFIAIIQDITQRKQTEHEMLEAREAMARAERLSALGIMAAGIAHEINQPLNSLKVMADGTLYWYRQGKVPEIDGVMETVQEISKEADRIDLIIKHMRSFIHNSECSEPVPCDLNMAVRESLSLIGAQLLSHGIEVKTDLAVDLPPVFGNSTQLEQIVINLVVNAMQALDTVDKCNKQIDISTGWRRGHGFLAVSDNGPGIGKDIKKKIFDPFFTTKTAGEGMGLGLSIIYSIITCYGGNIKVKDNKGTGGATFQVEFPIITDKRKGESTG